MNRHLIHLTKNSGLTCSFILLSSYGNFQPIFFFKPSNISLNFHSVLSNASYSNIRVASLLNQSKEKSWAFNKINKNKITLFYMIVKTDVVVVTAVLKYWSWMQGIREQYSKSRWFSKQEIIVLPKIIHSFFNLRNRGFKLKGTL